MPTAMYSDPQVMYSEPQASSDAPEEEEEDVVDAYGCGGPSRARCFRGLAREGEGAAVARRARKAGTRKGRARQWVRMAYGRVREGEEEERSGREGGVAGYKSATVGGDGRGRWAG